MNQHQTEEVARQLITLTKVVLRGMNVRESLDISKILSHLIMEFTGVVALIAEGDNKKEETKEAMIGLIKAVFKMNQAPETWNEEKPK